MDNLTWGEYVKTGAANQHLLSSEKKVEKKADKKVASEGKIDHAVTTEGVIKEKGVRTKKTVKKKI